MAVGNDNSLARLLGAIYTETFQRRPLNPNKPINRSTHNLWEMPVLDDLKTRLVTEAGMTFIYGPGGPSDEASSGVAGISGRYSFTATYG